MIKLIVFDLWDTLAYRDIGYSTTTKILEETGVNIPKKKFVKIFEKSIQRKRWKSKFEAYKNLCKNMELETTNENVNILMKIRDRAVARTKPYPHTIPMLRKLRKQGYKIGLISNSSVFDVEQIKKRVKILEHIDYPLFSYDVGVIKPHPLVFKRMLEITKVKPNEAIMIGDDADDDIKPAKKLGLNTIHFTNYRELKRDFSKFSIRI